MSSSVTFLAVRHPMDRWYSCQHKPTVIEIDCYQVRRELSDYLEGDLTPQLRLRIERHLQTCDHCTAVYDGLRNVVRLLGDEEVIELPEGFSQRLYKRLLRLASAELPSRLFDSTSISSSSHPRSPSPVINVSDRILRAQNLLLSLSQGLESHRQIP